MANFIDELLRAFGRAVRDAREKVVEEPFWGRALSRPGDLGWTTRDAPPLRGFDEGWSVRAPDKAGPAEPAGHDHER